MKRSLQLAILLCSASGISFPAQAQAQAQEGQKPDETAQGAQASNEIIVTAQRKSESLQRVPIAVTALSGSSMRETGVTDLIGVAARVPSLNMGQQMGGAKITIRGIGLDTLAPGAEAPVAYYQDGVFLARTSASLIGFFDVDRVEVLRGPQGTLYGRNATGGAINVLTRDPTNSLDGYFVLTGGTYNMFASEGAIGGPITDGVEARIAFRTSDHDGYGKNLFTGKDIDTQHERAVRAKLKFEPATGLTILLTADYEHAKDTLGINWHYLGQGGVDPSPTGVLLGGVLTTRIRDISSEIDPLRQVEAWGLDGTVSYDLGFATMKSTVAYRRTKSRARMDLDMTSFPLFSPMDIRDNARQLVVETQLNGSFGGTEWLVGATHFQEKDNGSVKAAVFNGTFVSEGLYTGSQIKTNAQAVFAEVTHHVSTALSATIGGRYSTERKRVIDQQSLDLFTPASFPLQPVYSPLAFVAIECSNSVQTLPICVPSKRWNSFTPKFGLKYQANAATLIYLSATKGFRSGGYSLGAVQAPVNPETVWSYEVGLKARFLEGALQTNLAAFYYDYSDLQVTKAQGTQTILENAATARVKGIEAEIVARPLGELQLDISGAYLDARFRKYVSADPARPAGDGTTLDKGLPAFDLAGNRLPQAPEISFLSGAQYTFHEAIGNFTLRGEAAYTSRVYFSAFNRTELSEAKHTRINAYINFASADRKWTASLIGRNLTNKVAPTNSFVTTALVGSIIAANIERPRTIELSVGRKF
jgi:iron complex outermembrane receptor protein